MGVMGYFRLPGGWDGGETTSCGWQLRFHLHPGTLSIFNQCWDWQGCCHVTTGHGEKLPMVTGRWHLEEHVK